jgi:hypothetical protein
MCTVSELTFGVAMSKLACAPKAGVVLPEPIRDREPGPMELQVQFIAGSPLRIHIQTTRESTSG